MFALDDAGNGVCQNDTTRPHARTILNSMEDSSSCALNSLQDQTRVDQTVSAGVLAPVEHLPGSLSA